MNYILTHPHCNPSAKMLRDAIQARLGERILVTSDPTKVTGRLLVRYGNSNPVKASVTDTTYNTPKFIQTCSSKEQTSKLMAANKIPSPVFYQGIPDASMYPVMVRTTLMGSGGIGISIARNPEEYHAQYRPGCHFTPYVRTSSEYRVHVVDGEIVKVFKKLRNPGLAEEDFPVRNLDRGYHFSVIQNVEAMSKLCQLLVELNKFLPGCFYALDCGYRPDTKSYLVFELNSAPGLNEETAGRYASALLPLLYPGRTFNAPTIPGSATN